MQLWASILLVFLGFLAIFIELFIPAGGLVGAAGVAGMVVGIVFAFKTNSLAGALLLVLAAAGTPALIALGFKVFPRTYAGKRLILKKTLQSGSASDRFESLMGKEGVALSALRPSGTIRVGNEKVSVVTEGGMIEAGTTVKVVAVEGARIVVRQAAAPSHEA
ncbi:MAG TPA: NfeD family protein [Planctomycetota bacterium]|nr:NfeD family protein [Planctomycetota bacterium]